MPIAQPASGLGRRLSRWGALGDGEGQIVLWSFLYFFFLLTSYYILRPLREEMAVSGGVDQVPRLMAITFIVMVAANPIWSALVARVPRRRLLPWVYRFFIANLIGFFFAFRTTGDHAMWARIFYVWVSVFNLFAVAVFWGFMADVFRPDEARRLFGLIAAGGSAGAVLGPIITATLVKPLGPVNLLLVSALLLEAAAFATSRVAAAARTRTTILANDEAAVGGTVLSGVGAVFRSRYLLGTAVYLLCATLTATIGYLIFIRTVAGAETDPVARTRIFATADLLTNAVTAIAQTALVGRLLARLGLTATLCILPALAGAGLGLVAAFPSVALVTVVQIVRRAAGNGLGSPAMALLFTVVSREDKYKAKAFIDTVVYRGGDIVGANAFGWLLAAGLSVGGASALAIPVCIPWLLAAGFIGNRYVKLSKTP